MPMGQVFTRTDIARTLSLPANQSVTIFVNRTFNSTAPIPITARAIDAPTMLLESANPRPPAAISISPSSVTRLSPKRAPSIPPGRASATPGSRYKPTSQPICA